VLHEFFSSLNVNSSDDVNSLNYKNVTMYSLMIDNELGVRTLSRFYSLNMWLVNLYECFIFENFTSPVGTFIHLNAQNLSTDSTRRPVPFDQTLFFILVNGE
jgi:hypothetical protein